MMHLKAPLKVEDISKLKIGDNILLSGTIFTARDKAYNYLLDNNFKKLKGATVYHAGPIVKKIGKKIIPISAGPTTSARLMKRSIRLMKKYGMHAFIGKGGMDSDEMVKEFKKNKVVYLAAVGGAGVVYADKMKIKNIYQRQLGMADAIWKIEIKDFPLMVAMDSKGKSIYYDVYKKSKKKWEKFKNEDN